ncbi:hypothetical protein AB6C74_17545 [Vibrio splendidus]
MAIEAVKTAFDSVKFLKGMFDGHVDGVAKEKVIELQQQSNQKVLDIQQALMDLQAEIFRYQEANSELTDQLKVHTDLNEKLEKYKLIRSGGGAVVYKSKFEPIHYTCPRCISEKKIINILQFTGHFQGFYNCPSCEKPFKIEETQKVSSIAFTNTDYDPFG